MTPLIKCKRCRFKSTGYCALVSMIGSSTVSIINNTGRYVPASQLANVFPCILKRAQFTTLLCPYSVDSIKPLRASHIEIVLSPDAVHSVLLKGYTKLVCPYRYCGQSMAANIEDERNKVHENNTQKHHVFIIQVDRLVLQMCTNNNPKSRCAQHT